MQGASHSLVERCDGGILSGGRGERKAIRQADPEAAEAGGVASYHGIRGKDTYSQRSDRIDSRSKGSLVLRRPNKRLRIVDGGEEKVGVVVSHALERGSGSLVVRIASVEGGDDNIRVEDACAQARSSERRRSR